MILAESSAQSVAPWLALAVAIAAAGIAVWQAWEARKARTDAQGAAEQAAQAQADAASHAGRAAAAAETSADHQERMAKALEKGTERYRNLWAIRPARGQLYVLTNRTNLPAEAATDGATAEPAETIAVITGGARGIGRHLSEAFANAGYHVVVTATSAEKAEAAAAEISETTGGAVTGFGLVVDEIASVQEFKDSILSLESETGRRLQVLVNNAGRIESTEGPLWEADPQSIKDVVAANVTGVALMVNAFAPVLIDAAEATGRPSRIIDLNSGSGAKGTSAYAVYSAPEMEEDAVRSVILERDYARRFAADEVVTP